jgi:hypothetical protein
VFLPDATQGLKTLKGGQNAFKKIRMRTDFQEEFQSSPSTLAFETVTTFFEELVHRVIA